jgi:alternate signal-mediated exported protein
MNKFTKASIATGAGIVLLLGGAGTLAYWNDSASVGASTITAGTLAIDSAGDGAWTANGSAVTDIDDFRVVPGDTLVYTETFTIDAVGDNLEALLAVDTSNLVASNPWGAEMVPAVVITVDGVTYTAPTTVTDDNDGDVVSVSVTLPFAFDGDTADGDDPSDDDVNNLTKEVVVNLNALLITLTQQA